MDQNNPFDTNNKKVVDLDKLKIKSYLKYIAIIFGVFIVLLILFNTFTFTVDEREQTVITQFDKIIRVIVDDKSDPSIDMIVNNENFKNIKIEEGKGLFFKLPFLHKIIPFSNQLLTYDAPADEVLTLDKKSIVLDSYAQWRINNPVLFMQAMGDTSYANQRIDEYIDSKIREEIGRIDAHILVTDKNYMTEMLVRVKDYINSQLITTGVVVGDIRIKRTEYPEATYQNIFEQMRSERQAVATEYRSEGLKEAQSIRSSAEREATIIEAQAYEQAQKLRGEGDAEALKIYAEAYNKDPEFYAFWQTLQTYKDVIDKDTTIIISPDSDFAKYIYGKD